MHEQLFEHLDVGPVRIGNRVVFGPHTTEFGHDNLPTQRHVDYYAERAKGGAGLIITESTYVHPSAKSKPNSVLSCDPRCVPVFSRLADAVHEHGAKVFGQLSHRGRQMTSMHSGMPVWGVSPIPDPSNREIPMEVHEPEIAELLDGYAAATDHYRQAGYDGVEIHAAHGYLIEQFWSLWTNHRDDAYGGSLQNRMRFSEQVIERVRERCSDTMAVGMRVSADELVAGGLQVDDIIEILQALTTNHSLDYISVSIGTHSTVHVMIGDMSTPQGLVVPLAAKIKQALGIPVFVGLRIKEPDMAADIVATGQADAVVVVRGLIADAEWTNKVRSRRAETIRHCLGCNQDCRNHHKGAPIACVQNPAVGREAELGIGTLGPTPLPRRVLVVGGGPAGMEAARVATLRGHQVTLVERGTTLGGQVNLAVRIPPRREFGDINRYLVAEMERLDIDVRLGTEITPDDLDVYAPDCLVVATGSLPVPSPWADHADDGMAFLNVRDVLEGKAVDGDRVVVYDPLEAFWQGITAAEYLARLGHPVVMVSPLAQIGMALPKESLRPANERLLGMGVEMVPMTRIVEAGNGRLRLEHVYSKAESVIDGCSALVTTGSRSDRSFADGVASRHPGLPMRLVGDAVSPRHAGDAIREGHLLARSI